MLRGVYSIVVFKLFFFLCKGYGMEDGAFCGVFDGHGKNGHIVSKIVRNHLPSLLLNQKNALLKANTAMKGEDLHTQKERRDGMVMPNKIFRKWQEACVGAFKVMDKEIKLQEDLDCSCSGTTAVVIVKQVKKNKESELNKSFLK